VIDVGFEVRTHTPGETGTIEAHMHNENYDVIEMVDNVIEMVDNGFSKSSNLSNKYCTIYRILD